MTTVVDAPPALEAAPPTPGVRLAWRIIGSLAAAALLGGGILQLVSLLAHEERTFERTFAADGVTTVDIRLDEGSAEVVADDTVDEITVEVRVSDGLRRTGHEQLVAGDTLVLRGSCPVVLSSFCAVHYDVRVPPDVDVVADVDDGSLRVDGTVGTVTADGANGSIELFDVQGDVRIASDNGSLRGQGLDVDTLWADTDNGSIDLGFASAPSFVEALSDNGSVELRLPEVAGGYRVDMDTDNGSTDLGVATDPGSDRRITAETDNGDVRVLGAGATVG